MGMDALALMLTPPEIAKRLRVRPERVLAWIKSGELRAIDTRGPGGRSRFKVDPVDLMTFEAGRAVTPTPKVKRRRRKDPGVVQYV